MIEILHTCIGCGKCVKVCPFGAISVDNKMAKVSEACTLCGACAQSCPVNAIEIIRKDTAADLSAFKGVWVFAEFQETKAGCKLRPVTHELLSCGKKLAAELGEELCAVLIGDNVSGLCDTLAAYGADKVYLVENQHCRDFNTDAYATALVTLINKYKPSTVLYPSTYVGRDIAPRVASELYVGLTADCTGLSIKNGNLLQTRPAFGGNIMADILSPNTRPQMATVRPNVMKKNELIAGAKAVVVRENVSIEANIVRVHVVEKQLDEIHAGEKIDEARIIVSGGRGMKDKKGFALLQELAETLGGAVGASRAAVDLGLKPKKHQVGQSGTTVSPKLYVACGISGAVQHIVGMSSSDIIIAVNKDPAAPIFNVCKFGLVGDASQIIPRVTESLKKQERK